MRTATRVRLAGWKITSGWTHSVGRTMSGRHWHAASSVPGGTKQCLVSFFAQTVVFRQEKLQCTAAFVPLITRAALPSGRTQGGRSSKVTPSGNQSIFLATLETFNDCFAVAKFVAHGLFSKYFPSGWIWCCIMGGTTLMTDNATKLPHTRLFWHHDQLIECTANNFQNRYMCWQPCVWAGKNRHKTHNQYFKEGCDNPTKKCRTCVHPTRFCWGIFRSLTSAIFRYLSQSCLRHSRQPSWSSWRPDRKMWSNEISKCYQTTQYDEMAIIQSHLKKLLYQNERILPISVQRRSGSFRWYIPFMVPKCFWTP